MERLPDTDALIARARKLVPPRICQPDGCPLPADLAWRREELDGGRMLYFFASPWLQEISTQVRIEGGSLLALDTMTGQARQVAAEPDGEGQVLDLHLPPGGHALFVTDPERTEAPAPVARELVPVELGRSRPSDWSRMCSCSITATWRSRATSMLTS